MSTTLDDANYYTEPWIFRKYWSLVEDDVLYEFRCSDPRYHQVYPGLNE